MGDECCPFFLWKNAKKKEQRFAPTFVNLKSNTMKNTMQIYALFCCLQII